jgi:hypothetical protein
VKAAIILFADTDRPEGLGRLANALTSAREFVEGVEAAGIRFLDEFRGHPSIRSLVVGGHHVITF